MEKEEVKKFIIPILENHGVIKSALFGSFARGDKTEKSDVDLIVELEEGKTLLDFIGLKLDLEETIQTKVDLLTYNSIHPLLKDYILSEQEVFYEKKS